MAGERRKRQQRVRHEAGGAASGGTSTEQQTKNDEPVQQETKSAPPSNVTPSVGGKKQQQQNRGGPARARKGVSVATVDETKYYQPVTIMESKGEKKTEELEDAPQKYKRRGIVSNWSRYEERPAFMDEVEDGSDYLIGEDFSDVLQQQSQSTGAHLQLKGEESWVFSEDISSDTAVGMGALKVSDLASTIITIPFTQQLIMEEDKLPKQLLDYYIELASDNRKVYNPEEESKDVVDTADIIEQQMQKLRIAFFECDEESKDAKNLKNTKKQDVSQKPSKELELYESIASTIDFDNLPEETTLKDAATVDLTSKMCEAFGSKNLSDDQDEFAGFITPAVEESVQAEPEASSQRVPKGGKLPDKKVEPPPPPVASNTSENASSSGGGFNFGLPKLSSGDVSAPLNIASLHKLNKMKEEDIDVFTPLDMKPKEEIKIEEPVVDLDVPIAAEPTAPAEETKESVEETKESTQELEDWLDSVLDD